MWQSSPQPSKFAVVNNFFDVRNFAKNPTVVDGLYLDPITPNVGFNVYYTNEIEKYSNPEEWAKKLWKRVPKTFIAVDAKEYIFPNPITTSFIQIEYTNLQPKSYTPPDLQQPVVYKRLPIWVINYFLELAELPEFTGGRVSVVQDILSAAYNYYLEDLKQFPEEPSEIQEEQESIIKEYFRNGASKELHQEVLSSIPANLRPYTTELAYFANTESLIGQKAILETATFENRPTESELRPVPRNLSFVSNNERESLAFEQSMPIMYFYLTCRHEYKEEAAKFEQNRAYFASINEVAFLRNNYTNRYDGSLYIENGGDRQNVEVNDFIINEQGSWTTF